MSDHQYDPDHPPVNKEYQYYADLLMWEQDAPEINDLPLEDIGFLDGDSILLGTTTQSQKVF